MAGQDKLKPEDSVGPLSSVASQRVWVHLVVLGLVMTALVGLSLFFSLRAVEKRHRDLALTVGRSYHQAVVAMRQWNSAAGALYADKQKVSPNEYLTHVHRDVATDAGVELTLVNPAYMTRLVASFLTEYSGIKVRVVSLKPIRPENLADDFEAEALALFAQGDKEAFGLQASKPPTYRYVGPLHTQASCLRCHEEQNYAVGDLRGALSVSYLYAPFWESHVSEALQTWINHGFFFLLSALLIGIIGAMLVKSLKRNLAQMARIKTLEGLLPICASCKKIRHPDADDRLPDSWVRVERYIQDRTDAVFTHGLCPGCLEKLYPNIDAAGDP